MVITFLQSVLSTTPILFVQFGQRVGGAIDYNMQATAFKSSRIKGNVNYYNIDQFTSPFRKKMTSSDDEQELEPHNADPECNPCTLSCFDYFDCQKWKKEHVIPYEDHLFVNMTSSQYAFARTQYYYDRLNDLTEFWGFFPRSFLP